ncbi:hypothetical protein Syun_027687 [Stephania yunnanensis]|uniref:Uncharacterized protein n=1 Tax=Stephania yunnanensis TaxID=152371 RepID=A0AAP0HQF9_9MAGN
MGGTEVSRTPSGSDSVEIEEGEECFYTSIDLADLDATSFLCGPSDLSFLPSFRHHMILDSWRNKVIWNNTFKGAPPIHDIALYFGPTWFMDIVEPHNPTRYSYEARFWEDWEGHLESVKRRGEKVDYPYQAAPDYIEWDSVTIADVFKMADRVIAFLLGAEHIYESTGTTTQSEGGTTSTVAARQYGLKGKQPKKKP